MRAARLRLATLILGVLLAPVPASAFRYVEPGALAPALELVDLEGRRATVPSAGRPGVIVFWRPGQQLSDAALADLGALAEALAGRGVDFVAVAENGTGLEQSQPRASRLPLRFLLDRQARAGEAWGIIVYPSTAVVGADGRLLYYLPGHLAGYRSLVEAHVLRARGEISAEELRVRVAGAGDTNGSAARRADAAYRKGIAAAAAGRVEEAVAALAEALELAPDRVDMRLELGWARLEQGRPADALREFRAVLARSPESPAARMGVGIARLRLGEMDEGIRLLEEAVRLNPDPVRGHRELARAYEARGDVARAIEHYRWAYRKLVQGRK
jgi:tetratricopeptide (TPR) repeat protein